MSSQIYSRYVPPAKKQKVASSPPPVEIEASPTVNHSLPVIRSDASSTYARYVPPTRSKSKPQVASVHIEALAEANPQSTKRSLDELEEVAPEPSAKKPKKEKKLKGKKAEKEQESISQSDTTGREKHGKDEEAVAPMEGVDSNRSGEDDATHKRLMAKREKSLKKAERLSTRQAEERAGVEESEVPQEDVELHDLVPLPQPEPVPEVPLQSITSALPSWLASPIRVSPDTKVPFSDIGVLDEAVNILSSKGFQEAFAVQAAVLPLLLPGAAQQPGDVLVSAATGSGKTLAYVLPMIEDISRTVTTRLRGLIVMPTRELVLQARDVSEICATAFTVGSRRRVKIGTALGNENFKSEQISLMEQELVYDPEKFRAKIMRLNSKWENSEADSDGDDESLCVDEITSTLEDHVLNPIPKVDLLICTPGRLVEHLKSTPGFSLQHINWLVVDEADKLLDQSFQQWLDVVIGTLQSQRKSPEKRPTPVRKIILSATMTRDVGQLSGLKLYRPKLVVLEGSSTTENANEAESSQGHVLPSLLVEAGIKVDDEGIKPLYLLEILKREGLVKKCESPAEDSDSSSDSSDSDSDSGSESDSSLDSSDSKSKASDRELSLKPTLLPQGKSNGIMTPTPRGVLIFTKSNETAVRLGRLVALLEPPSSNSIATLTSITRSSARRTAIKAFESGKLSILIASDLVSRGLDLPNLAHVINYDIPTSVFSYVHRVGRTARAGKRGHAWTLFTPSEAWWFWNEIGRSGAVERPADTKISRLNISSSQFGEGLRSKYEAALEALKREASAPKVKKSSN